MPIIKQPSKLENLALTAVAQWISQIGERLMPLITDLSRSDPSKATNLLSTNVDHMRKVIGFNVPWMIFDNLAQEIYKAISDLLERTKQSLGFRGSMSTFIGKMNVGVAMTQVLLSSKLTRLHFDEIPKMMRQMFYLKFSQLSGLQSLNLGSLSGGWKTSDMEPTIISGLRTLHNLRELTINYDCTDKILEAICENCPKLQHLDLTSSKSITNASVSFIIKCKDIKSVQLYRTGITLEGFTKLLLYCEKMEDLGRCDELGHVLEYIDLTNSAAGPFQLKKYVSRYCTSNHLQLLTQLCPQIYSVSIFHNSLLSDLTILIALPELKELKLLSCDFFADQVKQVLEVKGCNIISLHLEHVDQLDMNALMYITQFCPVLQSLTLYNCVLVQHTSLYVRRPKWVPFRSLEKMVLVCEGTEEQFEFLMGSCLAIKYLSLSAACRISDSLMEKVMNKNPFVFLEELRILQSDSLSMTTVSRILTNCVKLRTLNEIYCWSLLTEIDIEYIKNYIRVNNLDLDISTMHRHEA